MKIVILAGGTGTRLWPISRGSFPKQFLHFGDKESLLQKSVRRYLSRFNSKDVLILTNQNYYHLVKSQIQEINPALTSQILVEPERKNTAPAIAYAVKYMQEQMDLQDTECFVISSCDHIISPEEEFLSLVELAAKEAEKGFHVIFGVRPNKPETGYGYIKVHTSKNKEVFEVEEFVEKPTYAVAQRYLLDGNYLWNSGIFVFRTDTFLDEMRIYAPQIGELLQHSFKELASNFGSLPEISIDYALMEKSKKVHVIPMNLTWSDVGSWDSVYDTLEKDPQHNVKIGNIVSLDTNNCLMMGGNRLLATIGVEDLFIIDTEDALLIGKKGESQKVKTLVDLLKKHHRKQSDEHLTIHRPWGSYTVLEEGDRYKIKRIVVSPSQQLSLQMHYHRSEHWVVVKGTAKVTIGETEMLVHENNSVFVPKGAVHRLENPGKVTLEMIEVQVGEYVGEDDIVRFEDRYGRDVQNKQPLAFVEDTLSALVEKG